MNNYFVYDGRANYSIDDACVLDCFEAKDKSEAKRLYVQLGWKDKDTVLCDNKHNIIW